MGSFSHLVPLGTHSEGLVIDLDRHLVETWSIFRDYAEPSIRDQVCSRVEMPDGSAQIVMGGRPMPFSPAMWSNPYANKMFEDERFRPNLDLDQGLNPAAFVRTMDQEGIDVAVVLPTLALGNPTIPNGFVGSALSRAYGRWANEYCGHCPSRLLPAYPVNLFDVQLGIKDACWAVETLASACLMVIALPTGNRLFHDPEFDPFWATVQDLNVPLIVHTLSSLPDASGAGPLVDMSPGVGWFGGNLFLHHLVSHRIQQHLALASFVVGGVLERFPNLKVVFAEAGGAWTESWLEDMDEHYDSAQMRRSVPWLTMKPSEYFHRQCLIVFKPGEKLVEGTVGGALAIDSVAWASDYPHYDAIFPGCVEYLCASLKERPQNDRRKILGQNAERMFV